MSARLHRGLTADGVHGYWGYPWGRKNQTIRLDIWYLEGTNVTKTDSEAIEAEVAFLFRCESGQWPQEQTEIHFHRSNERHRQLAKRIIDTLKEG